jgi:DNA-binding transcriptional LysR family regulator
MDNWDEIRTAYQVARLGKVSAAAEVLGVHHATVIRHVDALESRLGVKLFQRHARGYTPTEAGEDLLQVAGATEDQFAQLEGRLRGRGAAVTGELVVTTLGEMAGLIAPVLVAFQDANPGVTVRVVTDDRLFRLEYGEAHVAIRAGRAPDDPDNVVQKLIRMPVALYAHRDYVARHGAPGGDADLVRHRLVSFGDGTSRAPDAIWLRETLPETAVSFRISHQQGMLDAVRAGAGLGFLPVWRGAAEPGLVEVMPPRDAWAADFWIVTHVDLHRTAKVQAFLALLKDAAAGWPRA